MPSVSDPTIGPIVQDVMREFIEDRSKSLPVYRPDIKTEADADRAVNMPVICIWNEKVVKNIGLRFSVTIKGSAVGAALEKAIPRSHPDFVKVRDVAMHSLEQYATHMISNICKEYQCYPSEICRKLASTVT
jgi:hypothetical protein